jgi:hypothetical protein
VHAFGAHRADRHNVVPMSRWTCPQCDREFGRARQSHVCVPGCTVEECFAPWPAAYREIYDRIADHLAALGPLHADAVGVGVFLKSDRKLAEVRPKARSLSLMLFLPRRVHDVRVSRHLPVSGERTLHYIKLLHPEDVDEQLCDWLTESFDAATDEAASG